MSQPNLLLLHVEPKASSRITILIFNQPPPLRAIGDLLPQCFQNAYPPHFPLGNCVCFSQNRNFSKNMKFVFSGQMSLRIIVELLENPPVRLQCVSKPG